MSGASNPFAGLGQADFDAATQALLPRGDAFPPTAPVQSGVVAAIADGMAAVHGRLSTLTEVESDPLQTSELLPDWELDYGLPDPCLPLGATLAQRRAALAVRLAEGEDPTPAYFVSLAATLGFTVTCTPATSTYGAGWQHVFYINAPTITSLHAHAGSSMAGDYLELQGNSILECVLRRAAPGHSIILFAYS